ncbi:MAG TPA: hypothetical protein VN085_07785, partial [Vicinamibacterales bacterium]|nr:hypothetical protein [Vicinamibacterales bacterium]
SIRVRSYSVRGILGDGRKIARWRASYLVPLTIFEERVHVGSSLRSAITRIGNPHFRSTGLVAALLTITALVSPWTAVAGSDLTPAGMSAARAALPSQSLFDNDVNLGWVQAPIMARMAPAACARFTPRASDGVVQIGHAANTFAYRDAAFVVTEASVLKTRAMAARSWRRWIAAPSFLTCVKNRLTASTSASGYSVSRLAVTRVSSGRWGVTKWGDATKEFRLLVVASAQGGQPHVVLAHALFLRRGRTEIALLTTTTRPSLENALYPVEYNLAANLVRQIKM